MPCRSQPLLDPSGPPTQKSRTQRQAAGRAFAAEFLAPVESVLDMVESGLDDDEIAGSFHVSPQVIARQIENRDRIREACTERAG